MNDQHYKAATQALLIARAVILKQHFRQCLNNTGYGGSQDELDAEHGLYVIDSALQALGKHKVRQHDGPANDMELL